MYTKEKLRKSLVHNKLFMRELFESNALIAKKVLCSANDSQLKLVIQILYFVSKGEIPLKKNLYEKLWNTRKAKVISTQFGTKAKIIK